MKRIFLLSTLLLCAATPRLLAADKGLDDLVKPFFAQHCVSCHGATKPKGDLRLDTLAVDFDSPKIMAHWEEALPGRILRVHHEDVVEDLDGSVRRILDYCELPFEQACVEFYKTERSIRTASSEQVRQPIYREGLDLWRHYEPWLGPLKDALGDALVSYRR